MENTEKIDDKLKSILSFSSSSSEEQNTKEIKVKLHIIILFFRYLFAQMVKHTKKLSN